MLLELLPYFLFLYIVLKSPCSVSVGVAQARGLAIRLATPSPADAEAARGVKYRRRHNGFRTAEKSRMAEIAGESIFGSREASAQQLRRQALLVKAAKVGIKTQKMRLLEADRVPPEGAGFRTFSRSSSGRGGGGGSSNRSERGRKSAARDNKIEGSVSTSIPRDVERGAPISRRGDVEGRGSALSRTKRDDLKGELVASVPKKRRRGGHSSAVGSGSVGGLAAIADLYD